MKIVIIPGVGYQNSDADHNYLGKEVVKKLSGWEYEIFKWNHDPIPEILKVNLSEVKRKVREITSEINPKLDIYKSARQFVIEVILDFEYALKYGESISVPFADYYIGHSAGTLFCISKDKPSTIMGSPYAIAQYIPKEFMTSRTFVDKMAATNANILNIINKYDVLGFPVCDERFQNVYFSGSKLNPLTYFPLTAHLSYWKSTFVINHIVDHIKKSYPSV